MTTRSATAWRRIFISSVAILPLTALVGMAVNPASAAPLLPTSISTTATNSASLGQAISDTAILAGTSAPAVQPSGTVTFRVYAPGDAACGGAPVFTSAVLVTSGTNVSSQPFTPTAIGTYRWKATYSGDANNTPAAGACNDTGESSTVSKASPTITTSATATAASHQPIMDSAVLSATSSGAVTPTGSVAFSAYGPNNVACTGSAAFISVVPYNPDGPTSSGAFAPTLSGTYRWIASYSGDTNNSSVNGVCNDNGESSVSGPPAPSITTVATSSVALGQAISDSATLAGTSAPAMQPTGTIMFSVYGPNNPNCTGIAAFTSTKTVSNNGPINSDPYTPTATGQYRWVASYSGDSNNTAVAGLCNDQGETSSVRSSPTITSNATSSATVGSSISDSATLASSSAPNVQPTGTITFNLYGAGNTTCGGGPIYSSTKAVSSNGPITSDGFTPSAGGTYRWVAAYSGDTNNSPVTGHCGDAGETSTITTSASAFSTSASDTTIGGMITDSATINGGKNPTGNVSFAVYSPNDANCAGAPLSSTSVTVNGNGTYTSPGYTPTAAGTYRWVARYSGDAANASEGDSCGAAGESSVVAKATPSLSSQASGGSSIADTATLSGGYSATGTMTFRAYDPSDAGCTGAAVFSSSKAVSGDGQYSSGAFTPSRSGTYRWIATYSGDANNAVVSGTCNDQGESSTATGGASPVLRQSSSNGLVTLTAKVAPSYQGAYFRFYVRSGQSGQVRSLGIAYVDGNGVAVRTLNGMQIGQHLNIYCKLSTSEGLRTPYSNDVAFTVH